MKDFFLYLWQCNDRFWKLTQLRQYPTVNSGKITSVLALSTMKQKSLEVGRV